MARLTHALDEIYVRLMEDLEAARINSDFDVDDFLLHVEDRFGEDVADQYFLWRDNG
jgi:hypothetical protein